jgi:hypothetical protein
MLQIRKAQHVESQPYSKLKAETRAAWRRMAREEYGRRGIPLPADFQESEPGDGDLHPPEAKRVARRAACLSAVALRGLAAGWPHEDQVGFLPELQEWCRAAVLQDEFEAAELEHINAPASELDQQSAVNASWRWEGVGVLLASLGRARLSAMNVPMEPKGLGDAAGVLAEPRTVMQVVDAAAFSPGFDRFRFADQMLTLHWRLREFTQGKGGPIDFVTTAQRITWAKFDLDGVPLVEGDLALAGQPIARAAQEEVLLARSMISERHHAANWLIGWHEIYSEVEAPT